MKAATDMKAVAQVIYMTRSLAIATLKQLYPDLYELSGRAFDSGPVDGISHHLRLGEFLTEWNNGLRRSPVEALAMGQWKQVEQELAARAGIYDDEI